MDNDKFVSHFSRGIFRAEEPGDIVTLDFTHPGEFKVYVNGVLEDEGTYSVQGNEFTWETSLYCRTHYPGSEKATYFWTFENELLEFNLKGKDKCVPRFDDIQKYTYKRVE